MKKSKRFLYIKWFLPAIVLLILFSCSVDFVEAGKAGDAGDRGMENVNWYIVPYVDYTLSADHTYYIATVSKGAKVSTVSIPGSIYTQWGDMPVKQFGGFEDPSDAESLQELHLGRYEDFQTGAYITVKVEDGVLDGATSLESITTTAPQEEAPTWGYLPTLLKEGYHFHGWYAGSEKVTEGSVITDSTVKAEAVFKELLHHEAIEPDCLKEGNIEHWECTDCHLTFTDSMGKDHVDTVTIPASGHHFPLFFHEGIASTCQLEGNVAYYSCDACGMKFLDKEGKTTISDVSLSKVDHKAGTELHGNEAEHWRECIWCGTELEKEEHLWGDWIIDISATEHTKGSRHHVCTVCGFRKDEDIPEHDHIQGEIVEKVEATCTSGAYYKERCGNPLCGEIVRFDIPDEPAKGHQGTLVPFKDSTCLEEGTIQHFHCDVCGKDYLNQSSVEPITGSLVIGKKDHQWSTAWTVGDDTHWHLCLRTEDLTTRKDEAAHVYDREVAAGKYLKSSATCQEGNTYYKSCLCGKAGTETFTDTHTASHSYTKCKVVDQNYHQKICEWCGTVKPNSTEAHSFSADGAGKKCSLCGYTVSGASGGFNVIVIDNTPRGHLEEVSHVGTMFTYRFVDDRPPGDASVTKLEWFVEKTQKQTDTEDLNGKEFSFEAKYPMTYKLYCRYSNGYGAGSDTVTVNGGDR